MTLVDANILVYAVGREHPHRQRSVRFLEEVERGGIEACIDAEILQELLHRYRSLGRRQEAITIYRDTRLLFGKPHAITAEVMDRTCSLIERYPSLMTRDAVHAAVVGVYGLDSICSFDRDFDQIKGLKRMEP